MPACSGAAGTVTPPLRTPAKSRQRASRQPKGSFQYPRPPRIDNGSSGSAAKGSDPRQGGGLNPYTRKRPPPTPNGHAQPPWWCWEPRTEGGRTGPGNRLQTQAPTPAPPLTAQHGVLSMTAGARSWGWAWALLRASLGGLSLQAPSPVAGVLEVLPLQAPPPRRAS